MKGTQYRVVNGSKELFLTMSEKHAYDSFTYNNYSGVKLQSINEGEDDWETMCSHG